MSILSKISIVGPVTDVNLLCVGYNNM